MYFTVLTRAPTTAIWPPWPNVLVSPLLATLLCSLAGLDLTNWGVRQPVQPHTHARLLVFDKTLAPHFAVVNCCDAVMSVFYSLFSTHSQNFAVMNCCVAALSLFSSDILNLERWYFIFSAMTHKISGVRVEEYAYYVNKLRHNVDLETWIWRQIVTSQTVHTKYKWPLQATEWNPPPWKFSVYATVWMSEWTLQCLFHRWRVMSQCLRILPRLDQSRN